MKKGSKKNTLISFENLLGLILALFIIFELPIERDLKNILNSPLGMIISLILLVIIFIFMNPIVGLLFLIYLYEVLNEKPLFNANYIFNGENNKSKILKNINLGNNDKVEIEIINKMAPIVKKRENYNSNFLPNKYNDVAYENL